MRIIDWSSDLCSSDLYDEGAWCVQDLAASLPARLLVAGPGEAVLDLFAAPGGKTMQLAAAGADVTAVEINPKRLVRLRQNLERTGLRAELDEADVMKWAQARQLDHVLPDAHCSSTRIVPRQPHFLPLFLPRVETPLV